MIIIGVNGSANVNVREAAKIASGNECSGECKISRRLKGKCMCIARMCDICEVTLTE